MESVISEKSDQINTDIDNKFDASRVKHSNSIIYLKNKFLDSICKLSMPERRVLWYYLRTYKYNDLSTVTIDVIVNHGEYAKLFSLSNAQAAHEIRKACDVLPDNCIYQARPEWKDNILDSLEDKILSAEELKSLAPFQKRNIVDTCSFGIRRGESEIIFTTGFLKLLLPVQNDIFTQYRLLQLKGISHSSYVDLYEELKRWIITGSYRTTPIKLINKFGLPETYSSFPQMRRGYLTPALKAINAKTDLNVECVEKRIDPNKPKSKVIGLKFKMSRKDNAQLQPLPSDID